MADLYSNRFTRSGRDITSDPLTKYHTRSGKTLLAGPARFDDQRVVPKAKRSHREALREAITFAQMAEHEEAYINKARETGSTAFNIAIVDWLGSPRVLEIDADGWTGKIGQTLRVKARDTVAVVGVTVVIRDAQNNVLESGQAVQSKVGGAWWNYTTKSLVPMNPYPTIEASAYDLAGNMDTFAIS